MLSIDGFRPSLAVVCILSVLGCSQPDRPQVAAGGSPPATDLTDLAMTQAQQQWADGLIAGFSPPAENVLPATARSSDEIWQFFRVAYPDLQILEQYHYRGFLLLPLRMFPDQRPKEDRNLLNVILVDLVSRKYQFALVART